MDGLIHFNCAKCSEEEGFYFCSICKLHLCFNHLCIHLERSFYDEEDTQNVARSIQELLVEENCDATEKICRPQEQAIEKSYSTTEDICRYDRFALQKKTTDFTKDRSDRLKAKLDYHLKEAKAIQKELLRRSIECSSFDFSSQLLKSKRANVNTRSKKVKDKKTRVQKNNQKIESLLKHLLATSYSPEQLLNLLRSK